MQGEAEWKKPKPSHPVLMKSGLLPGMENSYLWLGFRTDSGRPPPDDSVLNTEPQSPE